MPYGVYGGLVAVNLPASASHITMTGAGPLAVKGGEGPTWLLAAPVTLGPGTTSTAVVTFDMPGHHGSMTVVPSARVPAGAVERQRSDLRRHCADHHQPGNRASPTMVQWPSTSCPHEMATVGAARSRPPADP